MKTKSIVIVCHALIIPCIIQAMIQDIPKLSFEKIESYVKELKPKKYTLIENQLSNSFSFNVAMLPGELRYRIMVKMFNGNTELANLYYKTPLFYVCEKYHHVRNASLKALLSKEETEELVIQLFVLPAKPNKIIFNTVNPSLMTKLMYEGPVISHETLAELKQYQEITKKIFKNHNILIVKSLAEKRPFLFYIMALSILGISTTITVFPIAYPILEAICKFTNYCPNPFNYIWFTSKLAATMFTFYATKIPLWMRSEGQRLSLQHY